MSMAKILALALHIREGEAECANANVKAEEAMLPAMAKRQELLSREVPSLEAIEEQIAELEDMKAGLLKPLADQLCEIESEASEAFNQAMEEFREKADNLAILRSELGVLLGAESKATGKKTFPCDGEDFDLQVSATKRLGVADSKRAVETLIEVAPRKDWGPYLTPTKAGLDVIAAFAGVKDTKKPIDEIQAAVADYPGFTLEVTYTPKFLNKTAPAPTDDPESQIARAAQIFGEEVLS